MELHILKPRKALNKAFLKVKPNRTEIERFKANLTHLLDSINDTESEEFHKNLVIDFLKKTWYDPDHFVNTKGRNDLVIHNGDKATTTVGVIIETKKPTNKTEMLTRDKINVKAFQELVLYYLRERITLKNIEIKYLIATNINEWFIFDATLFDRLFAQNKNLVKQFSDFEGGRLADTKTDFFYKQIAEPFISEIKQNIEFTYFDIREFENPLRNDDKKDDNKLIALFKLLSPEHLLKLPFANDSNSLDKRFYGELLHIIGLTETKDGSKKIIERNKEGERNTGTFLENAIIQLDSLDKISRLENPSQFGANLQERLFNVGLELSITWINRILFLKLLEAQLVTYHKGDKSFEFLSTEKIKDYDDLNSLFFQVLARKQNERNEDVKTLFAKVPYLNSSLFEPTEIEHSTLFISQLRNDKSIPLYSQTVLKDDKGKKRTGEINPLEYLFAFLNAYDFASEGSEEIQEDNKTLINASVLGLIFEKINGYKDGSFFTPGFITMYMCRETIRKAVIQKFNETKGWNCSDIDSLYDKIEDRSEANKIVNDLKIVDPAVGSGHFLVSALNEMIAIKSDLKILQDRDGKRLKEYHFEVVNDELIVTDEDGELFEYNPNNKESQRIQETLFHEKQTIIENCLFGVDINPNSVKICRLRLWIELLKNAYYKSSPPFQGGVPEGGGGWYLNHQVPEGGGGWYLNHQVPEGGSDSSIHNLPHLKTFRKQLRNNLTPAEAALWKLLQGKNLDGRKFRRQHSVANYILDFYCPQEQLAIELDGQGHFEADQAEYDYERDLFLKHVGIKVLRFENKWVWDNQEGLLQAIRDEFGKQKPPRPADTPPFKGGELRELETLPNIDINIKCGNSLISRFALDADLKQALKKSAGKWSIDSYRIAVDTYRNAQSKEQKREMERLINEIKTNFRSEISLNDPKVKKLYKLNGELYQMTNQGQLFEMSKKEKTEWNKKVSKLTEETQKLETEIEEIKNNKIYENAFEWRFEFPEVLDDNGDFVGFDVVIGNPPYMTGSAFKDYHYYFGLNYSTAEYQLDLYTLFIELSNGILKSKGVISLITPNSWLKNLRMSKTRKFVLDKFDIIYLNPNIAKAFEEASVDTLIFIATKAKNGNNFIEIFDFNSQNSFTKNSIQQSRFFENENFVFDVEVDESVLPILKKIRGSSLVLEDKFEITRGVNPYDKYRGQSADIISTRAYHSSSKKDDSFVPELKGKHVATFQYNWDNKHFIRYGNWLAAPRDPKFFKGARLVFREIIGERFVCAVIEEDFIIDRSLYIALPKGEDIDLYYVLGVLCSKLLVWLFKYEKNEFDDLFPKIRLEEFKKLPIPKLNSDKAISQLARQIVNLKKQNAESSEEENQIDQLVYQLYELTEEEIKIIENSVK